METACGSKQKQVWMGWSENLSVSLYWEIWHLLTGEASGPKDKVLGSAIATASFCGDDTPPVLIFMVQ